MEKFRGVASFDTDEILILVQGNADTVASAFRDVRKFGTWVPDAHGKRMNASTPSFLLYQFIGHTWVTIDTFMHGGDGDLNPGDAQELSKALGTKAIFYFNSDTAGTLGYELFDKGILVEKLECADEAPRLETTLRAVQAPKDFQAAQDFVAEFMRDQDAFTPGWSTYLRMHAPSGNAEVQLQLMDGLEDVISRLDFFAAPAALT